MYQKLLILVIACIYIDVYRHHIFAEAKQAQSLSLSPVPWLGILIHETANASKLVTGVILVRDKVAIGNAETIVKLTMLGGKEIWKKTNVLFLRPNYTEWYASISEVSIHPEFNEETLVSIAVLFLEYDIELYLGDMLYWPSKLSGIPYISEEIFNVAYTERDNKLKQIVYRMKYVNVYSCLEFYINEELDSRWLRPINYHCYNVRLDKQPCVFDPGSALIYQREGKWFLLGISTWGPGCALPARFIDFEPYVPWIAEKITTRREIHDPVLTEVFWRPDKSPIIEDLDTFILRQLTNNSFILVSVKDYPESAIEKVKGDCGKGDISWKQLVYRDRTVLQAPPEEGIAEAVYGVSLYDLRFDPHYTCVMIYSWCDHKSASVFWTSQSFEQDHDLISYIRDQPINTNQLEGQTKKPYIYHLSETWEKYKTAFIGSEVTHLYFKFRFNRTGVFEVYFYSKLRTTTTTTTTEEPTTSTQAAATNESDSESTTEPTTTPLTTTTPSGDGKEGLKWQTRKPYRTSTRFPQSKEPGYGPPPGYRPTTFLKKTSKKKKTKAPGPTTTKIPGAEDDKQPGSVEDTDTTTAEPVKPKKFYWWNKWWQYTSDIEDNWWKNRKPLPPPNPVPPLVLRRLGRPKSPKQTALHTPASFHLNPSNPTRRPPLYPTRKPPSHPLSRTPFYRARGWWGPFAEPFG